VWDIKCGLDSRPFGSDYQDFLILIIVGRPNPCWIAHDKRIAMTKDSPDGVSAVPSLGGATQDLSNIQVTADHRTNLYIAVAFPFELIKKHLILCIQKMADLFPNGHCVTFLLGMLT